MHPHSPGLDGLPRQNRRQTGGKVTTEQRMWRRLRDSRGRGRGRGEEGVGGPCSDVWTLPHGWIRMSVRHSLSWGVMVVEEVMRLLWLRCGGGSDSGRGRISGSWLLLKSPCEHHRSGLRADKSRAGLFSAAVSISAAVNRRALVLRPWKGATMVFELSPQAPFCHLSK